MRSEVQEHRFPWLPKMDDPVLEHVAWIALFGRFGAALLLASVPLALLASFEAFIASCAWTAVLPVLRWTIAGLVIVGLHRAFSGPARMRLRILMEERTGEPWTGGNHDALEQIHPLKVVALKVFLWKWGVVSTAVVAGLIGFAAWLDGSCHTPMHGGSIGAVLVLLLLLATGMVERKAVESLGDRRGRNPL